MMAVKEYTAVLVALVIVGHNTVLVCAGRVWVVIMFWIATKLALTIRTCATRVWVEVEVAFRVLVTAAPTIVDIRVTAGRVDVVVKNEVTMKR